MKVIIISMLVATLFAVSAFAEDSTPKPQKNGATFEQRKANILKHIDERLARTQEEKTCVQAATNREGIKACREKLKAEMKEHRQQKDK
jgi:hypothetical protein